MMIPRLGALTASMCLLAGCSWGGGDGRDHDRDDYPHTVRGAADSGLTAASFALVNGSDVVRVTVADLAGDLYRISTPDDAGVAPTVDVSDSTVVAALHGTGEHGPAVVNVQLSDDVRWSVRLSGGAQEESVDLTGGAGGDVDLVAGTSRAAIALPAASGTQRVTLTGGAGELAVRLRGNAPARVAATGGAGSVTVDGTVHSGVGGGSAWTPAGWPSAADRYDINAVAGVSSLTVARF